MTSAAGDPLAQAAAFALISSVWQGTVIAAGASLGLLLLARASAHARYVFTSCCMAAMVAVPAATGDVTLFNPQGSTDANAIDVTASITDVRATCQDVGNDVVSTVTFTVLGLRRDAGRRGARAIGSRGRSRSRGYEERQREERRQARGVRDHFFGAIAS